MIQDAIRIGKKLAEYRLIDGASGNLSYRIGWQMIITRSGAILDELDENSFVKVAIGEENPHASSDQMVHQEIYKKSTFKAVLHCHGVFNVVLGLILDEISPRDLEGRMFLGNIRVIEGKFGSMELARRIGESVAEKGVAIVRGHGIYAAGKNFDEAFKLASYLEHSCEVLYRLRVYEKLERDR